MLIYKSVARILVYCVIHTGIDNFKHNLCVRFEEPICVILKIVSYAKQIQGTLKNASKTKRNSFVFFNDTSTQPHTNYR